VISTIEAARSSAVECSSGQDDTLVVQHSPSVADVSPTAGFGRCTSDGSLTVRATQEVHKACAPAELDRLLWQRVQSEQQADALYSRGTMCKTASAAFYASHLDCSALLVCPYASVFHPLPHTNSTTAIINCH
jgi:hypothetical protein